MFCRQRYKEYKHILKIVFGVILTIACQLWPSVVVIGLTLLRGDSCVPWPINKIRSGRSGLEVRIHLPIAVELPHHFITSVRRSMHASQYMHACMHAFFHCLPTIIDVSRLLTDVCVFVHVFIVLPASCVFDLHLGASGLYACLKHSIA